MSAQLKPPVILVHGIFDTARRMRKIERRLAENGFEVHSITLRPRNGRTGIEQLAKQLADFIAVKVPGETRFNLIGFSMGAIVSRYYLQRIADLRRIDHYISISGPHHGTIMGYLLPTTAAREMRRGSAFLRELNSDIDRLKQVNVTSLWTPLDLIIVPASSSHLDFGKEMKIPCALHQLMVSDRRCLDFILSTLMDEPAVKS